MKTFINILLFVTLFNVVYSCDFKLWKQNDGEEKDFAIKVERYDRLQSRYLTTGDFSALQKMNTSYPMETRMLIENILQLGTVDEPDINERFLKFYQDTTLQLIISDAENQYADMEDINIGLTSAMHWLQKNLPKMTIPDVYAQIGALDQSIVIGDNSIGISLDKYLGKDYPAYLRFYPEHQRKTMDREHIVPDCMLFYVLSMYPLENFETRSQKERDDHIARVMWVVNKSMNSEFFETEDVKNVEKYMKVHTDVTIHQLLQMDTLEKH